MAQALAKELLEVADNMERALGHVPEEAVSKAGPSEGADYYKQLCTFAEGIGMVNGTLQVSKCRARNDKPPGIAPQISGRKS